MLAVAVATTALILIAGQHVALAQQITALPPGVVLPPTGAAYCGTGTATAGNVIATPLTSIAAFVDRATNSIYGTSGAVAQALLKGLGTIEFLWFIYTAVAKKTSIPDMLSSVFFKIISFTVLLSIIVAVSSSNGAIVKGIVFGFFSQLATQVSTGYNNFSYGQNPNSTTLQQPIQNLAQEATCDAYLIAVYPIERAKTLASQTGLIGAGPVGTVVGIVKVVADPSLAITEALSTLVVTLFAITAAFGVLMLFGAIALYMLIVMIDASMMLGVAVFLLGFAGSRWTAGLSQGYFKYLVAMGFKVFGIQLVAGIVTNYIARSITSTIQANVTFGTTLLDIMSIIGILFSISIGFIMLLNVNKIAQTLATGTPSFGMTGAMLETAATAAVVAGGGVVYAQSLSKAGGAIKALDTANSTGLPGGGGAGPKNVSPSSSPKVPTSDTKSMSPPGAGAESGTTDTGFATSTTQAAGAATQATSTDAISSEAAASQGIAAGNGQSAGTSKKAAASGGGGSGGAGGGPPPSKTATGIRRMSNIASGIFHSNPMLSETEEDKRDPYYQTQKSLTQMAGKFVQAASDHSAGAGHGFHLPSMHGEV